MRRDARFRDDASLAARNLGVERDLEIGSEAARAGCIAEPGEALRESKQPTSDLAIAVIEVKPEVARARFGELDEFGFEEDAFDGDVELGDLLADRGDLFG